uniref:Uncharacterized protein n=1 Tax=Micrurus carvalhoi TaxID=3147026 RepID=A0A2H6NIC1_9SAUR
MYKYEETSSFLPKTIYFSLQTSTLNTFPKKKKEKKKNQHEKSMRGQYRKKKLKDAAGIQHTPVDGKLHISFLINLNQFENETSNVGMNCPPRKVYTLCIKPRIY